MAQWLVLKGRDEQFTVDGLAHLKDLAKAGDLQGGDLIQPPGTAEWLYVEEVPDLKDLCVSSDDDDDDLMPRRTAFGTNGLQGLLVLLILAGVTVMFKSVGNLPEPDANLIGEGGLQYSEMLVTHSSSALRATPDPSGSVLSSVGKDEVLHLMAKRGAFYRAQNDRGVEGWVPHEHVIPIYQLGGLDVINDYDPLYNPDRYFEVANANWQQLPDSEEGETSIQLMLKNLSVYDMTDLVLLVTIRDSRGQVLETKEIAIEGTIPADSRTMIGTLADIDEDQKRRDEDEEAPPMRLVTEHSFNEMVKEDPELQETKEYRPGAEVWLEHPDYNRATIEPLELRAVPTEEALERMQGTR
jgi:hypothetical protein